MEQGRFITVLALTTVADGSDGSIGLQDNNSGVLNNHTESILTAIGCERGKKTRTLILHLMTRT